MKMILILSNLTMPCAFHFYFFFFSFRRRDGKQEEIRVSDIRRHDKQDLSKNFWKYCLNLKHLKKKYALYVMFAHD